MKTSLILLTRNERPCLEVVFPQIPPPGPDSHYDEIFAIDGGSTDGTLEFFEKHNVPVIGQSKKGRGEAMQLAFEKLDSDLFVFFSPDGNEDAADIKRFLPLAKDGADIIIASRMMKESKNEEDDQLLRWRKWANNAFNLLANVLFRKKGPYITDSINGFRAITKDAAKKLQLNAPDYTIEYQMTIRGFKHQMNIVEFPTIEGQRVAGETGAPAIPTGLRFLRRLYTEFTGN